MNLNYERAAELFALARYPERGKPIANNTRIMQRPLKDLNGSDCIAYAIRFHETDVVTFYPDGSLRLESGGWYTNSTKDRMEYAEGIRIGNLGGNGRSTSWMEPYWYVSTRPERRFVPPCLRYVELWDDDGHWTTVYTHHIPFANGMYVGSDGCSPTMRDFAEYATEVAGIRREKTRERRREQREKARRDLIHGLLHHQRGRYRAGSLFREGNILGAKGPIPLAAFYPSAGRALVAVNGERKHKVILELCAHAHAQGAAVVQVAEADLWQDIELIRGANAARNTEVTA